MPSLRRIRKVEVTPERATGARWRTGSGVVQIRECHAIRTLIRKRVDTLHDRRLLLIGTHGRNPAQPVQLGERAAVVQRHTIGIHLLGGVVRQLRGDHRVGEHRHVENALVEDVVLERPRVGRVVLLEQQQQQQQTRQSHIHDREREQTLGDISATAIPQLLYRTRR